MSVAGINSAKAEALASPTTRSIRSIRAGGIAVSWQKTAVIALVLMVVVGAVISIFTGAFRVVVPLAWSVTLTATV